MNDKVVILHNLIKFLIPIKCYDNQKQQEKTFKGKTSLQRNQKNRIDVGQTDDYIPKQILQ